MVFISIFMYNILIINILHYILLPITYLFTSNAENKKRTQFAHLHIAGKDAVAHHRNAP